MKFLDEDSKRVYYFPNDIIEIKEFFNENTDAILVISFMELSLQDVVNPKLELLLEVTIRHLILLGGNFDSEFCKPLLSMHGLISLQTRYIELDWDFTSFVNLERLIYVHTKGTRGIATLKNLKELSLWQYKPKTWDLNDLEGLSQLNLLRLGAGNFKSLSGIENLKILKKLFLISNRSLKLSGNQIYTSIDELYVDACLHITPDVIIKYFPNLKKLRYRTTLKLPTIKPLLLALKNLNELDLVDTFILEDNKYWEGYKNKVKFTYYARKHQSLKEVN